LLDLNLIYIKYPEL